MDTEADLPRSNVRRIVKQKLTELKGTSGNDIHLNRDALTALGEAARVFIHLLSATANDICLEQKRQTISVDDVLGALEDLEFSDLISELEESIEEHRNDMKARAKKRSESLKKRRSLEAQKAAETETGAEAEAKEEENGNKPGDAADNDEADVNVTTTAAAPEDQQQKDPRGDGEGNKPANEEPEQMEQ